MLDDYYKFRRCNKNILSSQCCGFNYYSYDVGIYGMMRSPSSVVCLSVCTGGIVAKR